MRVVVVYPLHAHRPLPVGAAWGQVVRARIASPGTFLATDSGLADGVWKPALR